MRPLSGRTLGATLVLSLAAQFLFILCIYVAWRWVAGAEARFWAALALAPPAFVANALPISLGGLGVGEAGLAGLFGLVGSANGAVVFLLFRIPLALWSVAGAATYVFTGGAGRPPREDGA